jgi:hypothetical protein
MDQEIITKKCSKCQETKNITEFYFRNDRHNYFTVCKECKKIQKRMLKLKHPNRYKEYNCLYKIEHKKERNEKLKIKRKIDVNFKIIETLRARINIAIKNNKKINHSIELLGCTPKELKQYLELQFKDGMSWDNYGLYGWHIDHIIPCSIFDMSDPVEQKQCFHYSNLQPLWAKDNLIKGDKII